MKQDLDNSIPSLEDPLSSLENATLKIRSVFCSSGAVKIKKVEKSHIFVVHSYLILNEVWK